MFFKKSLYVVLALVFVLGTALAACAQPTAAPTTEAQQPEVTKLAVGIVLPTKDEPRWIQDETAFKEASSKDG